MIIKPKTITTTSAVTKVMNLKNRIEIFAALEDMHKYMEPDKVTGPDFCIFMFISSYSSGFEVKFGFPVESGWPGNEKLKVEQLPNLEVLSMKHSGNSTEINKSYGKLYQYAASKGLISDEFCREVYHLNDKGEKEIELQFVIHNWINLLSANLDSVLQSEKRAEIMTDAERLVLDSDETQRFQWIKEMMKRLDEKTSETERYEILTRCAHVFPAGQLKKLAETYQKSLTQNKNHLEAVDAVIEFIRQDPGWGKVPVRKGNTILSTKNPSNPKAYEEAETEAEKRKAYCFCSQIRNNLEAGLSPTYCYCGAGWERQQWEAALGRPVKVEVLKSLLKGDDCCQFAIDIG
ncbi:MAG: GyrI-like domain-containing protein [Candidatus Cloacimonetes bacterium]|nr:GyrI-like domain-containing protein [Candidatus Cloacimonadota bacterium]